jgi:serine/threonine protein kinase
MAQQMYQHTPNMVGPRLYGNLSVAGEGQEQQRFLLVRALGNGIAGSAQMVKAVNTDGSLQDGILVRKVDDPAAEVFLNPPPGVGEGQDVEIHKYLQEWTRIVSPLTADEYMLSASRIVPVFLFDEIAAERVRPHLAGRALGKVNVSYMKYCNGGDMNQIRTALATTAQQHDSRHWDVPTAFIAKLIHDQLASLRVLYSPPNVGEDKGPILHRDLVASNVFVDWSSESPYPDFYMGDFGFATFAKRLENPDPEDLHWDVWAPLSLALELFHQESYVNHIGKWAEGIVQGQAADSGEWIEGLRFAVVQCPPPLAGLLTDLLDLEADHNRRLRAWMARGSNMDENLWELYPSLENVTVKAQTVYQQSITLPVQFPTSLLLADLRVKALRSNNVTDPYVAQYRADARNITKTWCVLGPWTIVGLTQQNGKWRVVEPQQVEFLSN